MVSDGDVGNDDGDGNDDDGNDGDDGNEFGKGGWIFGKRGESSFSVFLGEGTSSVFASSLWMVNSRSLSVPDFWLGWFLLLKSGDVGDDDADTDDEKNFFKDFGVAEKRDIPIEMHFSSLKREQFIGFIQFFWLIFFQL